MSSFKQQEAMNRFGAILPYALPGRQPSTLIWAQTPSSKTWPKQGFEEHPQVALPTEAERNGNAECDYLYLWVGLLPADANEYDSSKVVRDKIREKVAEEKERQKTWKSEVWSRMSSQEKKEWSTEEKKAAMLDGAIDTRCVLDEDKFALRVVARIPGPRHDSSFAGGVLFHVLGRDQPELEAPLCTTRTINKDNVFYFEEFHSMETSERSRSADFIEKIRSKLNEIASGSTGVIDGGTAKDASELLANVEKE